MKHELLKQEVERTMANFVANYLEVTKKTRTFARRYFVTGTLTGTGTKTKLYNKKQKEL